MDKIRSKQEINYRGAFPSLRRIAREADVLPSTFTRLAQNKDVSAKALLNILQWLRLNGERWDVLMTAICKPAKIETRRKDRKERIA